MKKALFTLIFFLAVGCSFAEGILFEGFEYANHDMQTPIGWTCTDQSWLCGYLDKDHNRTPHTGNWYAFTNTDDAWMFMPLYFSHEIRYRFTYWAIADGSFQVEFWLGNGASSGQMSQQLFTDEVTQDNYEEFSTYIEDITSDYQYFGIHAIAASGSYHLSIDDLVVDMVGKYDMEVTPYTFNAILNPGEQATIQYTVQNTGYEPLEIFMTPYSDYFTNVQFHINGNLQSSFPTEPTEKVDVTCTAVLRTDLDPGTIGWMDIMFTVSCDCVTRMATLWVTVGDPTQTTENNQETQLFPNPTIDYLNINVKGLQRVEVNDLTGKTVLRVNADRDDVRLDLTPLLPGMYFVTTISKQGTSTQKLVKQ